MNEQQMYKMIADVAQIKQSMEDVKDRLRELERESAANTETLAQAKGGWRTLLLIGGAASLVGSLITQLVQGIVK